MARSNRHLLLMLSTAMAASSQEIKPKTITNKNSKKMKKKKGSF